MAALAEGRCQRARRWLPSGWVGDRAEPWSQRRCREGRGPGLWLHSNTSEYGHLFEPIGAERRLPDGRLASHRRGDRGTSSRRPKPVADISSAARHSSFRGRDRADRSRRSTEGAGWRHQRCASAAGSGSLRVPDERCARRLRTYGEISIASVLRTASSVPRTACPTPVRCPCSGPTSKPMQRPVGLRAFPRSSWRAPIPHPRDNTEWPVWQSAVASPVHFTSYATRFHHRYYGPRRPSSCGVPPR